jgi:hypothetical protein
MHPTDIENHKKACRSAAQRNQNVARQDDKENSDADEEIEEKDGSMDEDEDEPQVEARDDMDPANLFDEVSLSLLIFTTLRLLALIFF